MKKIVHRAEDRGRADYGWLKTHYSFSFANWYEPTRMGFGALRVINDDRIAPHSGFDMHGHKDMEIITIVTEGTLTHEDNLGNIGTVKAGDIQVMSAGTGVIHSERNASPDVELALFQIWIEPKKTSVAPHYEERHIGFDKDMPGRVLLVGPEDSDDVLPINQDAYISYAMLDSKNPLEYNLFKKGNGVYIFVISGEVSAAGESLEKRDAVGISEIKNLSIESPNQARTLIIEVPDKN